MNWKDKVFVALDNCDREWIKAFLANSTHAPKRVKIGLELFCRYGPSLVEEIWQEYGVEIFLDLKIHDIPSTMAQTIKSLNHLPIRFLTVHLSAGKEALISAMDTVNPNITIVGVAYPTSLDSQDFATMWGTKEENIPHQMALLFNLAHDCKVKALVLSPQELPLLKNLERSWGKKMIKICPGIRFPDEIARGEQEDQKRVSSPAEAISQGANYLVMGRSITTGNMAHRALELNKTFLEGVMT